MELTSLPVDAVPLSAVRKMVVYDEQTTTMRVRWEEAEGATGYMLLYSAINATQGTQEEEVRVIRRAMWVHECVNEGTFRQSAGMTHLDENWFIPCMCVYRQTETHILSCIHESNTQKHIAKHQMWPSTSRNYRQFLTKYRCHTIKYRCHRRRFYKANIICLTIHKTRRNWGKIQRNINSLCQANIIVCSWGVKPRG